MTTDREQEAVSIAMTALRERDEALAREAALVKHGERDDFRRIAQNFSDELGRIGAAIGTDEFMPEGAPVPLETKVLRMKAALGRARGEVLDLRYVIAGIMLDENNRGMSVKDKWESALKAITDVIVDGSVVSQGYADRIRRDGIAAGRLDREGGELARVTAMLSDVSAQRETYRVDLIIARKRISELERETEQLATAYRNL